jgi:hypothetical protein
MTATSSLSPLQPSSEHDAMFRTRVSTWKSDFDYTNVPDTNEIDYSFVPFDPSDEKWGFNNFFYEFKCRNPADPQQALFIKRNEITALKRKALFSNAFLITALETPRDVKRQSVCESLHVTKDLNLCVHQRLTCRHEPIQFRESWCVPEMPYSKQNPTNTRLWPTVSKYDNNSSPGWGCAYMLFYMGVKYGALCTQALYDEIVALYASQYIFKKAQLDKRNKVREEARQGNTTKAKVLIFKQFFKMESAKFAYALGLHPEDDEVAKEVEKALLKRGVQQTIHHDGHSPPHQRASPPPQKQPRIHT